MNAYALRAKTVAIIVCAVAGCTTVSEITDEVLVETGPSRFRRFEPADPGPWYGPLAEEYAGQVVFSSEYIPHDSDDDGAVITEYRPGGNVTMELGRESVGFDNVRERIAASIGSEEMTTRVPHIVGIGSESIDIAVRRTFSDSMVPRSPDGSTMLENAGLPDV